jgi:NDP-sugar pyrophosphorylase family protein
MITKGMILAAGLGTRLRPLTYDTPKPLIQVGDKKIIEYNLLLMAKSGITDVVINLHHLGNLVEQFLDDGVRYGLNITYSTEPEILGTGGGIKNVEDFFGEEPFVLINCDVLANIRLKSVLNYHLEEDAWVTMVVRELRPGERYAPVKVENGRLVEFKRGGMMYTGIQVINPQILGLLPDGTFSDIVSDAYIPYLKDGGKISAYNYEGFWTEIGTLESLESAREAVSSGAVDFWYL